jgi:hypothetical protein
MLRDQGHNGHENMNKNTAVGVNKENIYKIHIVKTLWQVKHTMAPAF